MIAGIAEGCRQSGCALVGGETAELPGLYHGSDYDLAGFCVGVVEKAEIRPHRDLAAGDIVVGLPSAGLHSNGHSLARKIVFETLGLALDARPPELGGSTVADEMIRPTIIYAKGFQTLREAGVPWESGGAHHGWRPRREPRRGSSRTTHSPSSSIPPRGRCPAS